MRQATCFTVMIITITTFLSCKPQKLIVNFKDVSKMDKTLSTEQYELLYTTPQMISEYQANNNIISRSTYADQRAFFYQEMYPKLEAWKQEANQSVIVPVKSKRKMRRLRAQLEKDPNVRFVQVNEKKEVYYFPNDPLYSSLWNLIKINCAPAWDFSEGRDVLVAVIDHGIFINHQDLRGNLWSGDGGSQGGDFTGSGTVNPIDGSIHGTHVGGTIGAIGNNSIDIIGVAPRAKILPLKVFPGADDIKCAQAFYFAIYAKAKVINNSWGPINRSPSNPEVSRLIDIAYSKNINVVFAAGNKNDDVQYYAPANHPRVIAVGAVNNIDQRAPFSNYGNQISVSAPGVDITSLQNRTSGTAALSGTSMAAPHVSGLIALILQINSSLTPEQIKLLIENSATRITTDKPLGFGRIDAYNTLRQLILSQRRTIKFKFSGTIRDHDDIGSDEICNAEIPFQISLLADGQINTGEFSTAQCDNEVWAKIFYSCSMDLNNTLQITGKVTLYDDDNYQGEQSFNIRINFGQTGTIVTGTVTDGEQDEDQIIYKIQITQFE